MAMFSDFGSTFFIAAREGIEAFLVTGILLGLASKDSTTQARRMVYLGALAGVVVSLAAGLAIVFGFEEAIHEGGEVMEVIGSLVAAAILVYMIVWMYRHTITMVGGLPEKAKAALSAGKPAVFAGLAFVAIVREGLEIAFFVGAEAPSAGTAALGIAVGIIVAFALAFALFKGLVKLSLRDFFIASGLLLAAFGGYILWKGLAEFAEEALELGEAGEIGITVVAVAYVVILGLYVSRPWWQKKAATQTA